MVNQIGIEGGSMALVDDLLQLLPPEAIPLLPFLFLALAVLPIFLFRKPSGEAEVGVVGLGVMGSQLCLNLAEKTGGPVAGFDRDDGKVAGMRDAAQAVHPPPVILRHRLARTLSLGLCARRRRAGLPCNRRRRSHSSSRA